MQGALDLHVAAWLAAIAEQGWHDATLHRASELSGLSSAAIIGGAGDKLDAVSQFQDWAAREAAEIAAVAGDGTVRERLFDGMMRGFDMLQEHREAVLRLRKCRDPGLFALAIGRAGPGLRRLAAAAGADVGGVRGQLRLLALAGLGAKAFETWSTDESPDMAATMAELDRLLGKAEQAETEGFNLGLVGLSGLPNPFDRARRSSPDLPLE